MWTDIWAVMQMAQHWMELKFCALPIKFSFFLCLFPVNFAGLPLVFHTEPCTRHQLDSQDEE